MASRTVDVRWQERGPRSIPGDYDSNAIESFNDSVLVKKDLENEIVVVRETGAAAVAAAAASASAVTVTTTTRSPGIKSEPQGGTSSNLYLTNTSLDDIFISVKTTRNYHKWRLPVILKTWFQLAKNQTWFFTDTDDFEFQKKTDGHMINTNCSSSHNRKALCCKMSVEFDVFLESNKKWFCHFDDDNYVNVPRLVTILRNYNSQQDWYLGKPSIRAPLEIITKDVNSRKISFWFATGGAGFCLSRALALKMMPVASGGKFISVGEKIRLPDDVTMGYIIEHLLRKHLTVVEQFHSHLEPMKFLRRNSLQDQISFSYSRYGKDDLNVVKIEGFDYKIDPTRFLSLHCFLFPNFKFCPR
ncbi:Fringe glycosyltransferase, putative [Pediculus humanus corporis]|uniref:Fringe glycosyltransferase, putative n=1 Tax=Pediculus humanus subsp. corporis TaxID=121224 RepID=E0V9K3_PEDHC|nr:Fringe glycosyltransferase, putative [Pediculus humanus corporis]EEB10059.1 Fringe glycosyltransferase, putative [Pediculus humanus corporis]